MSKEQKTKTHALRVLGAPPTPGIVNGGQSLRARLYPQRKSEGADVLPLTAPSPLPQFTSHCSHISKIHQPCFRTRELARVQKENRRLRTFWRGCRGDGWLSACIDRCKQRVLWGGSASPCSTCVLFLFIRRNLCLQSCHRVHCRRCRRCRRCCRRRRCPTRWRRRSWRWRRRASCAQVRWTTWRWWRRRRHVFCST